MACTICNTSPVYPGNGWIRIDGSIPPGEGHLAKCPECNGGSWDKINERRQGWLMPNHPKTPKGDHS